MKKLYLDDPAIALLIEQEKSRQKKTLNLIASENYAYPTVLRALGSELTDKYAEGTPGARFYAGCEVIDKIEQLAIERCTTLFGAEHANVQPHSGSQANMAVYHALLQPGDTMLALDFSGGGHLSHGHPKNFSGKIYTIVTYGVDKQTHLIDYDDLERLALLHKPRLIIAGGSSYSRIIDFARISTIAHNINAYCMADIAHTAGLISANLYPNPVPFFDVVTGTTHKTLRGPRGGFILCKKELSAAIDRAVMPGIQGGPHMNTITAKAITFLLAAQPTFKQYQKQVLTNARSLAHALSQRGYKIVSAGTDTPLFVIDLTNKNLTGKQAEDKLSAAGITVSRSCIPFDTQKASIGSGIRIGLSAATTRGYTEKDSATVADLIDAILADT